MAIGRTSVVRNPRESVCWLLVAADALLGRLDEAHAAFERLQALKPEARNRSYWKRLPFRDPTVKGALIEGVKRAEVLA